MKIMPVMMNICKPQFTARNKDEDLRSMLENALTEGLQGKLGSEDSFIPSAPSQPIIIDKLEIHNNSSKNNKLADTATGLGVGGAGGVGISKISDKNGKSENQNVNYEKIADNAAEETRSGNLHGDEQDMNIEDNVNDIHDLGDLDEDDDFEDEE